MAVGRFFFSSAAPAQNSPELHFRFYKFFYPTISARKSGFDLHLSSKSKVIIHKSRDEQFFMEHTLRFGLLLGQLAVLKKNWANYER